MQFNGLNDKDGNPIACYTVKRSDDSYGEYNYHMIVVPAGTDLTRVAPVFTTEKSVKLYAEGSNSPEVSGESYHDVSSGILQYTASAEDGVESKNYWLQIITATGDKQDLFINSFSDPASHTEVKDGVIYPVYCGSGQDNIGVRSLMDGMGKYLPAPSEIEEIARVADTGEPVELVQSETEVRRQFRISRQS